MVNIMLLGSHPPTRADFACRIAAFEIVWTSANNDRMDGTHRRQLVLSGLNHHTSRSVFHGSAGWGQRNVENPDYDGMEVWTGVDRHVAALVPPRLGAPFPRCAHAGSAYCETGAALGAVDGFGLVVNLS
jgi:hypothetical protein